MKSLAEKMDDRQPTVLLQQRYGDLREMVHRRTLNRVQMLIGAPFYWYEWSHIRKELRALKQEIRSINAAFNVSQTKLEAISRRGWNIAGEARQVVGQEKLARQLLEQFRERRVHGEAFETAQRQHAALRASLEKIPKYFLSGDEAAVLEQADKESIADVYEILEETRSGVASLVEQVQAWRPIRRTTAG
jgi:predicted  nucleic acid-binding Zn-ribbon protein